MTARAKILPAPVAAAFARGGLCEVARRRSGEWVALLLQRCRKAH